MPDGSGYNWAFWRDLLTGRGDYGKNIVNEAKRKYFVRLQFIKER
jgi:hypothetical protein